MQRLTNHIGLLATVALSLLLSATPTHATTNPTDYNGDGKPDLYMIDREGAGTNSTEVHVLNGATNFQSWLLHTGTALHKTGLTGAWAFAIADYNGDGKSDLYIIDKEGAGTNSTEVHVLNGATNFQSWLLHTGTLQPPTGSTNEWSFLLADYNKDGKPDLYMIDKEGAGTNSTEVHVLNGATNFQSWLLHTGTVQHPTGINCEWDFATGGDCINMISPDTSLPNGSITSPASGSVIGPSFVTITADASDNPGGVGVAYVDFFIRYNGLWFPIERDTNAPYAVTWQPPADLNTQLVQFTIHVADNAGNIAIDPGGYRPVSFIVNKGQENWVASRFYLNQRALGPNGDSMCSMASIAMIRASAGLVGGDFASLSAEAQRVWNTGLRGPSVSQVRDYLNRNGMSANIIWDKDKGSHWNKIKQEIIAGRPVILNSNSQGGSLTSYGHYIVVVGYREDANPALRQIIVYDPFGEWTGTKDRYYYNSKEHDTPNSVKGRFKYYTFANLGTIYSVTAQRTTFITADIAPTSPPDEIYEIDSSEVMTYTGDGERPYPVQIYLPLLQR